MSGAHKLAKLHQYHSDRRRVIHLARALDVAGWPTQAIVRMTGLNRQRVERIVARVHWYWVPEDEEFYNRIASDLPWLRGWQRELLGVPSGANLLHKPQYADIDIIPVDNPPPLRRAAGG